MSKVVLALVSVLEEVERLTRAGTTSLLYPLVSLAQTEKDEVSVLGVGSLLPHLQELYNYVDHTKDLLHNILAQAAVLLSSASPVKLSPGRLLVVWDCLAQLLSSIDGGDILPEADIVSNIIDKLER